MRRTVGLSSALVFALSALACGGSEEATETPPAEAPAAPPAAAAPANDWVTADDAAKTVTIDLVAGQGTANNNWNFNGHAQGNATVTVPTGYSVTINFSNQDPNMAHSAGVIAKPEGAWSATPSTTPSFAGAITSNPTSMTEATKTGASETITFTADKAGVYAIACLVPGHAAAGMWIAFTVADGGTAGVS
jgi:sulfocyanin